MDDQLKQLFDYTKFHIGMYTTLIAGIVGLFTNANAKLQYVEMVPFIKGSVLCFVIAGMAGGLVASSIAHFSSFKEFKGARLGPWRTMLIPSMVCVHVEHSAFWLGCSIAVYGLFYIL
jgi:hypothetical protein